MTWLPKSYMQIQIAGVDQTNRATINFLSGATASDDPSRDATDITIMGSGSGITALTGDVLASGVGSVDANVVKINRATVPAAGGLTTGNVLQVTGLAALAYGAVNLAGGTGFVVGALPAANQAPQTMVGNVTGTTAASVVTKVNGATVPAAGALVTGNAAYVSGASALSYSALNLAGGSGWVTGALPVASIAPGAAAQVLVTNSGATAPAWVSLSGDSSVTAAGVVTNAKINGASVPAAGGALVTGNGPYVSGASALTYSALNLAGGAGWVTGILPAANQASQAIAGDVTGTTAASVVAKVNAGQGQFATTTTDFLGIGGTSSGSGQVSATGYLRFPSASATLLAARRTTAADLSIISVDGSNNTTFGTAAVGTNHLSAAVVQFDCNGGIFVLGQGSTASLQGNQNWFIGCKSNPTAFTVNVFSGTAITSGNNGGALGLGGGASGGGAGLRGATNISVGNSISDTLASCAEVIQNNRVLALCQGAALTSTQMPANTGDRVVFVANAETQPSAPPSGGYVLYGSSGNPAYYTSAGQQVTLPSGVSASATAGAIALPLVVGYLVMSIAGTTIKVPYLNN